MDACIAHARITKFALLAIPKPVYDVFAKEMFCYCRSFHFFIFTFHVQHQCAGPIGLSPLTRRPMKLAYGVRLQLQWYVVKIVRS
jgi:hypothetical protein